MQNICSKIAIPILSILLFGVMPILVRGQIIPEHRRTLELSGIFGDFVGCSSSPEGTFWAFGTNGIIVTSSDQGASWQRVTLPVIHDIRFLAPGRNGRVFIGCIAGRGVWYGYSDDNGKKWQEITLPLLQSGDTIISAKFTDQGELLAGTNSGRLYNIELSGNDISHNLLHEVEEHIISIQAINEEFFLQTTTNIWHGFLESDTLIPVLPLNNARQIQAFTQLQGNLTFKMLEPEGQERKEKVLVYKSVQKELVEMNIPLLSFIRTPLYIIEEDEEKLYMSDAINIYCYNITQGIIDSFSLNTDTMPVVWQLRAIEYTPESSVILVGKNNALVVLNSKNNAITLKSQVLSKMVNLVELREITTPSRLYAVSDSIWLAFTEIPTKSLQGNRLVRNGLHNYIYRSVDKGITYTCVAMLHGDSVETGVFSIKELTESGKTALFGQTWGGAPYVLNSDDKGITWKITRMPVPSNIQPTGITAKDNLGRQYFAGRFSDFGTLIFYSTDGFSQTAIRDTIISGFGIAHLQLTSSNDLLAVRFPLNLSLPDVDLQQEIIRRKAGEREWQVSRAAFHINSPINSLWEEEDGSLWIATPGKIWKSIDNGDSWEMVVELGRFQSADKPFKNRTTTYFPCIQLFGTGAASWSELLFLRHTKQKDVWHILRPKEQYKLNAGLREHIGDVLRVGYFPGLFQGFDFSVLFSNTTYLMRDSDPTATSVTDESSGIEALPGGWLYSPNPNPATTVLRADVRLYTGITVQQCKLGLYDVRSGKLVYDATPELQRMAQTGGRTTIEIPTAEIPSGAYLLQLTTEKSIHTRKVIINR